MFVGWGSEPYFSEYSAGGQLLFDAHMHGSYESYRAYRFPWTGAPGGAPAIAAAAASGGRVTVYASWNGDTRTASWRVLAGASAQTLAPVASAARAAASRRRSHARRRRRTSPCRRWTPPARCSPARARFAAERPGRLATQAGTLCSFDVKEGFSTGGSSGHDGAQGQHQAPQDGRPRHPPTPPRYRRLPTGAHGLTREEVERDQRERLRSAMIELIAERGYPAVRILDLTQLAHVSRPTFYNLYADKEELLLSAYEDIAGRTTQKVAEAYEGRLR